MGPMTRRRNVRFVVGGVAVAVLLVGLGAAGAIAASGSLPARRARQSSRMPLAQLGVDPRALSDALKQALENRIDAAVEREAHRGTGRRARRSGSSRVATFRCSSAALGPDFGHFGPRFGHFGSRSGSARTAVSGSSNAAADRSASGDDGFAERLDNETLAEIAKDRGKSVYGLMTALVTAGEKEHRRGRWEPADLEGASRGASRPARDRSAGACERRASPAIGRHFRQAARVPAVAPHRAGRRTLRRTSRIDPPAGSGSTPGPAAV